MKHRYGHLLGYEFDRAVIEENVLVQLNNLSTHPVVAARLATGEINLYGWYYEIETGVIDEYNQGEGQFLRTTLDIHPATPTNVRKIVSRPVALAPPRSAG